MNIALYGPGRAGGALVIAAARAGHAITSIDGRDVDAVDALTQLVDVTEADPDILVIAVSDDAIASVAAGIDHTSVPSAVIHMSGAVSIDALAPFGEEGASTGSFHPLQTLPSALVGANRLVGAHVAITAPDELASDLEILAESLGCVPFRIGDEHKALYHAGASAAANFTMAALGIADGLFRAAGVDPVSARPLVEAIVANAYEMGPLTALTGPIARGDVATVAAQIEAVEQHASDLAPVFAEMARATAAYAGRSAEFREVLS